MKTLGAILLGWVLGCALQLQQAALWSSWVYGIACLPSIVWLVAAGFKNAFFRHGSAALSMLVTLLLALALGWGVTGMRAIAFQMGALLPALEGVDIQVVGVVAAMPQRSEAGLRLRLDVESGQAQGQSVKLPARIYLSWYSGLQRYEDAGGAPFAQLQQGSSDLNAGERWAFTVRLKAPHGNVNPHGFDYELWLWEQGLQATGYIRATERDAALGGAPRKLGTTWQHPLERARQHVRDAIFSTVAQPRLAGVVAALVVGDQAAIERADWDIYRATGVAHLMSISGLHVTMFAWGAALCVGWLWRRSGRAMLWLPAQHAALLGGVLLACGYALFSGWGVPSQRTVGMLATVALLRLSGKQWPWPMVWLLAMAVVVAADPWALLQAGFWLSFVAVGVLFASGAGQRSANKQPAYPVLGTVIQAAREQFTITLALAPLTLLLFQQVSLVGLLANALAIPWVTLVVTPLALLGVLYHPLWDVAAHGVYGLSLLLEWLSSWPIATFSIAAYALFMGLLAILGGFLLMLRVPWPLRSMGAALVLPVLLWQPARPSVGQFELLAADIGQGNAVLVRTAQHSLLYDTGPRFSRESDAGQRTLVPLLRGLGEKLNTVLLSHRDSDHTGGAAAVLAMQPQATLLSSLEEGHALLGLRANPQRCTAGQKWQWDGVDFAIVHPDAQDYTANAKSNALSCVLRISNGQQTALLVADIEAAQEAKLVAAQAPLQADILLVPHHGSKTSSTEAFLDAVRPRIALGQLGYRNRFNHPAPEVAQRYADRQIQLHTTPRCGAAWWRSDKPEALECQRSLNPRYWQHQMP